MQKDFIPKFIRFDGTLSKVFAVCGFSPVTFGRLVAIILGLLSEQGRAETPLKTELSSQNYLVTSSRLGFGALKSSSTGFGRVGGSMAVLDVGYRHGSTRLSAGWRSIAQGGHGGPGSYYRLGTGPWIAWQCYDDWTVHGSLSHFKESGLDQEGQSLYESKGRSTLLGWYRSKSITSKASMLWGTFISEHRGSQNNTGITTGIEVGLSMIL